MVGGVVGLALIMGAIYLFRRRQQRNKLTGGTDAQNTSPGGKAELDNTEKPVNRQELPDSARNAQFGDLQNEPGRVLHLHELEANAQYVGELNNRHSAIAEFS